MFTAGCANRTLVLTEQVEARRLASDLRVQFSKAAEASNRAVMADTDEASGAAAREAGQAAEATARDVEALDRALRSLGYNDETRLLEQFKPRFAEYRTLDAEILPLAVENTNLKAQRLAFGPGREAAASFRQALDGAARHGPAGKCCVGELAARATASVLEVQVVQARHIAESDEAAMTRMEAEMAASEAAARRAIDALKAQLRTAAASELAAAAAALDRFKSVNAEIVALSRRNSNVRSLALSLGRKRAVTAECDEMLHALDTAVAAHAFTATR